MECCVGDAAYASGGYSFLTFLVGGDLLICKL